MNPWTALLESLHSALIDELTERSPEPKPVLGLPIRKSQWTVPATHAGQILIAEISQKNCEPGTGFACLTLDGASAQSLGMQAQDLWAALLRRAGTEFGRRGIQPLVSRTLQTDERNTLPSGLAASARAPSRVIWIPISAGGGQVFLGLGI